MSKFFQILLISYLIVLCTSVKMEKTKKKKQKICTKLSRPIREIADMKKAIATNMLQGYQLIESEINRKEKKRIKK